VCPGWPFSVCGVQQGLAKETKMIAALKQHYERYHAGDLAALKKLYEYHAENCVRAADLTVDPRRREEYLNPFSPDGRPWIIAASTRPQCRHRIALPIGRTYGPRGAVVPK
jgi:hypothetical protein